MQWAQAKESHDYNKRRRLFEVQVGEQVLLQTYVQSSALQEAVAKFTPKFEGFLPLLQWTKFNNLYR